MHLTAPASLCVRGLSFFLEWKTQEFVRRDGRANCAGEAAAAVRAARRDLLLQGPTVSERVLQELRRKGPRLLGLQTYASGGQALNYKQSS